MVIKLQGGLGNQMFQYAYGISNDCDRFDATLLGEGNPPRKYELGAYDLPIKLVHSETEPYEFGYWQSEHYFNIPVIRHLFRRPICIPATTDLSGDPKILPNTTFIGVRRTDYLWNERLAFHGVMEKEYYHAALDIIKPERVICFSDDPLWTREHMGLDSIQTQPAWDIYLMSLCQNAIIANSSFHWWGAWLGPDAKGGQVIAPKRWFVNQNSEIVPSRWTKI